MDEEIRRKERASAQVIRQRIERKTDADDEAIEKCRKQHRLIERLRGEHPIPGVSWQRQAAEWMTEAATKIEELVEVGIAQLEGCKVWPTSAQIDLRAGNRHIHHAVTPNPAGIVPSFVVQFPPGESPIVDQIDVTFTWPTPVVLREVGLHKVDITP